MCWFVAPPLLTRTPASQLAEDTVIRLLNSKVTVRQRKNFAERCVANLKAGVSVFQSLRVLRRIIDLVPRTATRANIMTQTAIVEGLNEREHLLEMFFSDLRSYHDTAKAQLLPAEGMAVPDPDNAVVADGVGHLRQINTRFDFLYFVLRCSPLTISTEQALLLWDCLVADAISPAEVTATLGWLRKACRSQWQGFVGSTMFADGAAEALFTSRMIEGDHRCPMSKVGFECLRAFFVLVNEAEGRLKRVGASKDEVEVQVLPSELVGLQAVWRVALEAKDALVAKQAIGLLNALHNNLGQTVADKACEVQQTYLQVGGSGRGVV